MGTYGLHKPHGQSFRETLEKEFDSEFHKVIDCSIIKRKVAYLACKSIHPKTKKETVYALVCKLDFLPNTNEWCNFYYKPMEEDMGPYYFNCPKRILDLLSPTDSKTANEWRESCRNRMSCYSEMNKEF